MNAPTNPYESPEGLSASPRDPDRELTATFVVDEAWLCETKQMLTRAQDLASGLAGVSIMVCGAAIGSFAMARPTQHAIGFLAGTLIGAIGGWVISVPLAIGFKHYNRRTQRHPPYPLGDCRVVIDLQNLTITCASKRWTYPLKLVRHGRTGDSIYFRIARSDDRFVVRQSADFGEDSFESWRLAVSRRVKLW